MFGASGQSGNSRFANVSVNMAQQMPNQNSQSGGGQQQVYQQIPTQPQQQYLSLHNSGSNSVFGSDQSQYQQNSQQQEPVWFNNPKKRSIPQTIVRRPTKQTGTTGGSMATSGASTTSLSSGSTNINANSGFENLTFGSKKSAMMFNSQNNQGSGLQHGGDNNLLVDSNEAPPTVSLYDWKREDDLGTMSSLPSNWDGSQSTNTLGESLISSARPESLNESSALSLGTSKLDTSANAFDKNNEKNLFSNQASSKFEKSNKVTGSPSSPTNSEGAVIVFGYPESVSNSIITHFSKFGNILEDFQVLRSASGINVSTLRLCGQKLDQNVSNERKYPIFTGDGWVKLTYDSSASALRALQENGTILGGSLIGCIPYSKEAVEQLASCKIEKIDDIGLFNHRITEALSTNNEIITPGESHVTEPATVSMLSLGSTKKPEMQTPLMGTTQDTLTPNISNQLKSPLSTRRLDIKDGKSLFVHNANSDNHNFLRSLENKMRHQEELNVQQKQQQTASLLHKVNDWLFGWNDL
ncbi:hypothetical protein Kpol_1043p7 [Vanderwaltozyma polyspora DSM 70294]|uniref:RRM Nup35-type domain-containing protein n=1 Tax=Vanderwaltozyma polyspora (strain ATCC 22028 / DSM 70294 / BCRC 21397 / CBS 2163 / NBRC 10782 / NRRL Y-8283 / UCD 57-17) TaxID=436907 RepID=A7TIM5_VANPO|nr:uncharacterized protein Kpol_1043p7 [Vanderwaltozyma polyspora DSM 70294]EDO17817.1 hypothetical protein Kpol_1043p7 [Vanderwaltozyma polyspora DSM 70294]